MSVILVRAALETALGNMVPPLDTAWENKKHTPITGTPYQRVTVLFAQPDNSEISRSHGEHGFMQVDLAYPTLAGSGAAQARAELLRATFYRGASFSASGVVTTVMKTPEIMPGYVEADRFVLSVRVRFYAFVV